MACAACLFPDAAGLYARAVEPDNGGDADSGQSVSVPRRMRPLRVLANVVTILLAGDVVLAAAVQIVRARDAGPLMWLRVQSDQGPFVVLAWVCLAATAAAFLLWSYRGVVNAEIRLARRRYARDWIFWGWVVPVANLWFPFRITNDLLRASRPGWPAFPRVLLPLAWWIIFLGASSGEQPVPMTRSGFGLFTAAALACIILVRVISAGEIGGSGRPDTAPAQGSPALTA